MRAGLLLGFVTILASGCSHSEPRTSDRIAPLAAEPVIKALHIDDVEWEQLNPARGDQSPKAATLWGDRNGPAPTGFLVQFVDGFASPPHIHNVSYRGVVISGRIHNDDPAAANMWMPPGSFWTQPMGESHITAASGATNIAYIEIEDGPYLVLPVGRAFDSGERPVNVDPSNVVWLDSASSRMITPSSQGPKIAHLWGTLSGDKPHGSFLKLPAGYRGQ